MAIDPDVQVLLDVMQAEIDALANTPPGVVRNPIKYKVFYDDGSIDEFDLVP